MKSIEEMERLLTQTPPPRLVEGPHREQLKERLLMQSPPVLRQDKKVKMSLLARMSPALKVAAVILAAALLVGVGWAAEKIYETLKFKRVGVTLQTYPAREWRLPDGKIVTTVPSTFTVVDPNDPQAVETALRRHEEIKQLIDQKKYKLHRTYQNETTGRTEYVYRFALSDGSQQAMNFSVPLESVDSWEEYRRKEQEWKREYHEQVNRAFAEGEYRLLDQDFTLVHICLDKRSQRKFRVYRFTLHDGKELAAYRPYDAAADNRGTTEPQSSWQEHLQAIREGTLELLDVETVPKFTYEVVFDDGAKHLFRYDNIQPPKPAKSE